MEKKRSNLLGAVRHPCRAAGGLEGFLHDEDRPRSPCCCEKKMNTICKVFLFKKQTNLKENIFIQKMSNNLKEKNSKFLIFKWKMTCQKIYFLFWKLTLEDRQTWFVVSAAEDCSDPFDDPSQQESRRRTWSLGPGLDTRQRQRSVLGGERSLLHREHN